MELLFFTMGTVSLCFVGLGAGLILQNRVLRGSCGGIEDRHGNEVVSCGACAKKEADVCPTDDELVRIAQLGHPDPKHHR